MGSREFIIQVNLSIIESLVSLKFYISNAVGIWCAVAPSWMFCTFCLFARTKKGSDKGRQLEPNI